MPLIGIFDDEGEFGFPGADALPPSNTMNSRRIVRFDDDERATTVIIDAAEVVRLDGTKLWLSGGEPQLPRFLAASVVKLDQRGFIRGQDRSQCAVHGYSEFVGADHGSRTHLVRCSAANRHACDKRRHRRGRSDVC